MLLLGLGRRDGVVGLADDFPFGATGAVAAAATAPVVLLLILSLLWLAWRNGRLETRDGCCCEEATLDAVPDLPDELQKQKRNFELETNISSKRVSVCVQMSDELTVWMLWMTGVWHCWMEGLLPVRMNWMMK